MLKRLFGNRLSDEESRSIVLALTSFGCIHLALLAKRIDKSQLYLLTEFFIHNNHGSSSVDLSYSLTSDVATLDELSHWSEIFYFMNKGIPLSNRLKKEIVLMWITFISITYSLDEKSLQLIGHYCRELNFPHKNLRALINIANDTAISGHYTVMAYAEGMDECKRIVQDAIDRSHINFDDL